MEWAEAVLFHTVGKDLAAACGLLNRNDVADSLCARS